MFACSECGKEYCNQNSLTRHSHNHRKTKQHKCLICGVVFFRHDLLSRHKKIHEPQEEYEPGSFPDQSPLQGTLVGRRRCHTACTTCRGAKIKCDGKKPCLHCRASGKDCDYSNVSQRVSQAVSVQGEKPSSRSAKRLRSSAADSIENPPEMILPLIVKEASGYDESQIAEYEDVFEEHPDSSQHMVAVDLTRQSSSLEESHNVFPGNYYGQFSMDTSSDTMAWSRLHEDMFLTCASSIWHSMNGYDAGSFDTLSSTIFNNDYNTTGMGFDSTSTDAFLHEGSKPQVRQPSTLPTSFSIQTQNFEINPENDKTIISQRSTPGPRSREGSSRSEPTYTTQLRIIEELVAYSVKPDTKFESSTRQAYWRSMSIRVQQAFELEEKGTKCRSGHILDHLVDLYMQHFAPLWPLLPVRIFEHNSLHPILYLTLTSIGGMYSGPRQSHYATMMHEHIRKTLLSTASELEDTEEEFLWLGQARLLTQVAALYFGQRKAFSYAQLLGGILIAQSRRLNLFAAQPDLFQQNQFSNNQSLDTLLQKWLSLEARKRLAFGILRAESYTSVLLNTRPILTPDEVDLEFPCSDSLWDMNTGTTADYLNTLKTNNNKAMIFSDIFKVIMDRREAAPALDPPGLELVLFGLQQPIWRFCYDPSMFHRLTGDFPMTLRPEYVGLDLPYDFMESMSQNTRSYSRVADPLSIPARRMEDLQLDRDRVFLALQKWKQSFDTCRTHTDSQTYRHKLISSLLLYHISFIRLHSPVENLHHIAYRVTSGRSQDQKLVRDVHSWTKTDSAKIAVQHACIMASIISRESQRPEERRARFNFLAFSGLHHATAACWAFSSACDEPGVDIMGKQMVLEGLSLDNEPLTVCNQNTEALVRRFVKLLEVISPGKWSSFATAALKLSQKKYPPILHQTLADPRGKPGENVQLHDLRE